MLPVKILSLMMAFHFNPNTLLAIALRGSSLLSKFALLFILSAQDDPKILVSYTVMFSIIVYSLYIINFDLYTYTTRILSHAEKENRGPIVLQHINSTLILCVITIPLLYAFFLFNYIDKNDLFYFYIILILEFSSTEIYRYLVACKEQNKANLYIFLKSSLWVFIFIIIVLIKRDVNIIELYDTWLYGQLVVLILSFFFIKNTVTFKKTYKYSISQLLTSIKVSIPILIGTLAIRGIFTFDRIYISNDVDIIFSSAYMFFSTLSGATLTFVDAILLIVIIPKLVSLSNNTNQHCKEFRVFILRLTFVSGIISILVMLISLIISFFPSYDRYSEYRYLILYCSTSMFIFILSQGFSIYFYSRSNDGVNIKINILSFLLFIILANIFPSKNIPALVFLTMLTILASKAYVYYIYNRHESLHDKLQ